MEITISEPIVEKVLDSCVGVVSAIIFYILSRKKNRLKTLTQSSVTKSP